MAQTGTVRHESRHAALGISDEKAVAMYEQKGNLVSAERARALLTALVQT